MKRIAISVLVSCLASCVQASAQRIITTVAGNGTSGFSGDGGPATSASLFVPFGVAVDTSGNVFVADGDNSRIRKVPASGIITTVAGNGPACTSPGISCGGFSGDGGPATAAMLSQPHGIAVDASGNLYIADTNNNRIRKVSATGIITTFAGGGSGGLGDGGPATAAMLNNPIGVAVDASGNLYIADSGNTRVRKVSTSGIITTVAGNGTAGFSGDSGPATSAALNAPEAVAVDAAGNLYIADTSNSRIRKVSASGIITTVAGNGTQAFSGDGGAATSAAVDRPSGVAVDASGNIFIALNFVDTMRVREVSAASGIITTFAGGGTAVPGDGGPATSAQLDPYGVAIDVFGNVFLSDQSNGYRIRKVAAPPPPVTGQSGIIITVAGNGVDGFSGDGGPATSASFHVPSGVAVDASGNLYIADSDNNRIRKVSASGIITTIAGSGSSCIPAPTCGGFSGDGGPATAALLGQPQGVAVDAFGNVYIADTNNNRIREVSANGVITTVAGSGTTCSPNSCGSFSGDGGPATSATLYNPFGVAVDASGNLYIADAANSRIRKVSTSGIITTVAGSTTFGFSGDGGPATSAQLNAPEAVAVDLAGNIYISDTSNSRIRKVSAGTGIITTVAGNGTQGFSGDGGPATSAAVDRPFGVAVDASGNIFIAVNFPSSLRVREVSAASGIITTFAGGGNASPGNGGLATAAEVDPFGLAIDASGNLFFSDDNNGNRIREVLAAAPAVTATPATISVSVAAGASSTQQISLTSPVAGLAWSTSTSASWITLTPSSGTTPATISVAINTASLQPGANTATITISNPLASPAQETVSVSLTVAAVLSVTPATLNFPIQQGAAAQSQTLQIAGTAGATWQATATTSTGGTWLSVSPASGQIPASLTVQANPGSLTVGTYQGSITISNPQASPPQQSVSVNLTVTAAAPPSVPAAGVTDGAGFSAKISGGGIGSIFGTGLAAATTAATNLPLPTTLGGVTVTMNGIAAPLFFVSPLQINFQVPWQLLSLSSATLTVTTAIGTSPAITVTLTPAAPGIFTINTANSATQGAIQFANTTTFAAPVGAIPGAASRPAPNGDILTIYCSGLGAVTNTPSSGSAAGSGTTLSNVVAPVTVTIGGQSAPFLFAGLSPGFVGLFQVNVQFPTGVASGNVVLVVVSTASLNSNTATIGVQ